MGRADPKLDFVATVRANLDRLRGSAPGPGIVAVSGGADSVALLRALAELAPPGGLIVAHLNHQLRGPDSDRDAAFVADLLPEFPHRIEQIDVVARATADCANLEATARDLRYQFLTEVARSTSAGWVATGHTLDDQAETILHRLIRGTGLRGLRGIAADRELAPGIHLVRPLLTVSRTDVIAYLQVNGQPWREDATNADPAFTRNRIRHELLPLLRTFNPAISVALSRTAEQANEVYTHIESVAADLLKSVEHPRVGNIIVLGRSGLASATDHTVREVLNLIWQREQWQRSGMTLAHWGRAANVVQGRIPACDLPAGIRIAADSRIIRIGPF